MTLAQLLRAENQLVVALKTSAPDLVALPRAVRAIRGDGRGGLPPDEIADFQERIAAALVAGKIEHVSRRDLRRAPDAFFVPPRPLGRDDRLRQGVLGEISRRAQKSAVYGIVRQYLEHFDAADPSIGATAAWLRSSIPDGVWSDRAKALQMFDPRAAPAGVARAVMTSSSPPRRVLEDLGLGEASVTSGLGLAAFGVACAAVAQQRLTVAMPGQQRLMAWAAGGRHFELDRQWPAFAEAMMSPWSAGDPPEEHRQKISDVLIGYAGDPGTATRTRWGTAPKAAHDLFVSWLTRASVLQFLDVVGEVARDDHWRYRRAFWLSYLEGRHIKRAWVAFGPRAVPYARRVQDRLGERSLSFGEVNRGTGRAPDQSALLVEIGDLMIVDWSHSGRYNVWGKNDGRRPEFFRARYDASALDSAPYRASHTTSERYGWQTTLAEIIRRSTGVTVEARRWRPGLR